MTELDYLLIALGLFVAWWAILLLLDRRKILERHNLSLAGPILMWKTKRGRGLIDRIARRRRFWRWFGDLSIVIVGVTMIATTALLIWEASLVQSPAVRANPPSPDLLLGIPGLNRLIPLGYGIFGLAVAIVLHEFCHGILSRAQDVKIQSLGGVFAIVPIGAFVEPDEDELRALPRHERARLYAAGPATNILLAILFAALFSTIMMASVEPVHAGVGIIAFTPDSPSQAAGIPGMTIITAVTTSDHAVLERAALGIPCATVFCTAVDLANRTVSVVRGTSAAAWVQKNLVDANRTPASYVSAYANATLAVAALEGGAVNLSVIDLPVASRAAAASGGNLTVAGPIPTGEHFSVNSSADFAVAMSTVRPNDTIAVETYGGSGSRSYEVTVGWDSTNPSRPIIGIYAFDVSTDYYHPLTNVDKFGGVPYAILSYISLPFQGRAPIQDPGVQFYRVTGPFGAVPAPLFWIFVNSLYWLFWLNAMLGATNALPAVPLDGGYIFKDGIESLVVRLRHGLKPEARERVVKQVTLLSALVILALILWQMIGPRL